MSVSEGNLTDGCCAANRRTRVCASGILGSGLMGGKLGTIFARAGHDVVFSYARSRAEAEEARARGRGNARAGTPREAAQDADALLLAVHWSRVDDVLKQAGDLSGKVIVTCSLPMNADDTALVVAHTSSGAEELAKKVRRARVVSAFGTVPSEVLFGVFEARRRRQAAQPGVLRRRRGRQGSRGAADPRRGLRSGGRRPAARSPATSEPFTLLVAQLAYEGDGGPELAYRFERFEDLAILRPARRLPYLSDAPGPALPPLRARHAGCLPPGPAGRSLCRALPLREAPRCGARDAQHESRQPGARTAAPVTPPAPVPSSGIGTRSSPPWRRRARLSSPWLPRAGSSRSGRFPLLPASSPARSSHHLRVSSNPGNSSRPPRPTTSSPAPRVRTAAAAHGPQTREQTTCRDSCDPAASRSSSSALPPAQRQGRRPGQARSARRSQRLGRRRARHGRERARALDHRLRRGRVHL